MVETITPVVHGGRRRRWVGTLALHVLGATLSAAALGAALGAAGALLGAPWGWPGTIAVAGVALLYAAREAFELPVPVLDARRQVPQWWREAFSPGTTAFLYGLGLGVGFVTHLRHGTLVAVAAASVAAGDPLLGAAALAAFGVARSVAVGVTWAATDGSSGARVAAALERAGVGSLPRLANALALAGLAAAAIAVAGRVPAGEPSPGPAVILASVFAWAALSKAFRPGAWRRTVDAHELPPGAGSTAAVATPLAEGAVPLLILVGSIDAAAGLALGLLATFSAAVLRIRLRLGDSVPCGCFGASGVRDARLLLVRNGALAVVAAVALADPSRLPALPLPRAADLIPLALAFGGALLAVALRRRTVALLREARPLIDR